ncbi:MAG: response regulator transcription factor [Planctomycetes bacterium]|nr:response regulator transcription factor [Planctomycetota bacterium]
MTRLLAIEDDADIRDVLVDLLQVHGHDVRAVDRAEHAFEVMAREPAFALFLLDLQLPGMDGLTFLRTLRERGDRTPVIVLTARGEEAQRIEGLRAGADDYVVKPFSAGELLARIDAVLRRTFLVETTLRIGECFVDLEAHVVRRAGEELSLLPREAELLRFLVAHPGRAFRREELLREVWGYDAMPTTRTIDTHVFQLRRKIEGEGVKPRHFVTVHRVGYRFDP